MQTKEFATADVLSTITGVLVSNIGGVYEVLNWMTGESCFTHQLPRIAREATPVVVGAHPDLQQAVDEAKDVNGENWETWRDRWIDRYGPTIAVPKFTASTHESIDPMSELAEKIHPGQHYHRGTFLKGAFMSDHLKKAVALAGKISAKAEDTLAKLDHEMTIMNWPHEFRAIMWQAVADRAAIFAGQSRASSAVPSKEQP